MLNNKEQTGGGYDIVSFVPSIFNCSLFAETCPTGLIYRTNYGGVINQPPLRIPANDYDPFNFSYGHIAPYSIELSINNLQVNKIFKSQTINITSTGVIQYAHAHQSHLLNDRNAFNLSYYTTNPISDHANQDWIINRYWLVPLSKDEDETKCILTHASLFPVVEQANYQVGNRYNIYMDLYLYTTAHYTNELSYVNMKYANPDMILRKNIGSAEYGIDTESYTDSSGFFNSNINATGWSNISFDDVYYSNGVFSISPSNVKFTTISMIPSGVQNINTLYDFVSNTGQCVAGLNTNFYRNIENQPGGQTYSFVKIPNLYKINIQVNGNDSNKLSGQHSLIKPVSFVDIGEYTYESVPLIDILYKTRSPLEFDAYTKGGYTDRLQDSLVYYKILDDYTINQDLNRIVDPVYQHGWTHFMPFHPGLGGSYFVNNQSTQSNISYMRLEFNKLNEQLAYASGSVTLSIMHLPKHRIDSYEFHSPYGIDFDPSVYRESLICQFSGVYNPNVVYNNGTTTFNQDIQLHQNYIANNIRQYEPALYLSGCSVTILKDTPNNMSASSLHDELLSNTPRLPQGYETDLILPCRLGELPDAISVDMTNVVMSGGYTARPARDDRNPTFWSYYQANSADANAFTPACLDGPFSFNHGVTKTLISSTYIEEIDCTGCLYSHCIGYPVDIAGTYLLQKGVLNSNDLNPSSKTCMSTYDCKVNSSIYYYKNPNVYNNCDWTHLFFRYDLTPNSGLLMVLGAVFNNDPLNSSSDTNELYCSYTFNRDCNHGRANSIVASSQRERILFTKTISPIECIQTNNETEDSFFAPSRPIKLCTFNGCADSHNLSFDVNYTEGTTLSQSGHIVKAARLCADYPYATGFTDYNFYLLGPPSGDPSNRCTQDTNSRIYSPLQAFKYTLHPQFAGGEPIITPVYY